MQFYIHQEAGISFFELLAISLLFFPSLWYLESIMRRTIDPTKLLHLVKACCTPQLLSGCVWTLNVRFVCSLSIVRPSLPSSNPAVSVFGTSWNHNYHKQSMMLLENVRKYDLGFRVYPFVSGSVKKEENTEVQCRLDKTLGWHMVCLKIDTSHSTNQVNFRVLLGLRLHSISRETCKKCFF